MHRSIVFCLVVLLLSACGDDADQALSTASPGKAVYDHYCADCHAAGEGHPGTMRLATRLDEGVLIERQDLVPEYVKLVVRNGYQMMPPFRPTEITDSELDALANYVSAKTIATLK